MRIQVAVDRERVGILCAEVGRAAMALRENKRFFSVDLSGKTIGGQLGAHSPVFSALPPRVVFFDGNLKGSFSLLLSESAVAAAFGMSRSLGFV